MSDLKYRLKKDLDIRKTEDNGAFEGVEIAHLLETNRSHEPSPDEFEIHEPPRSQKKRDYVVLMALINVPLLVTLIAMHSNPTAVSACLSGMVIGSAGISWFMWVGMSDY